MDFWYLLHAVRMFKNNVKRQTGEPVKVYVEHAQDGAVRVHLYSAERCATIVLG